jgi:hypothetical protein
MSFMAYSRRFRSLLTLPNGIFAESQSRLLKIVCSCKSHDNLVLLSSSPFAFLIKKSFLEVKIVSKQICMLALEREENEQEDLGNCRLGRGNGS